MIKKVHAAWTVSQSQFRVGDKSLKTDQNIVDGVKEELSRRYSNGRLATAVNTTRQDEFSIVEDERGCHAQKNHSRRNDNSIGTPEDWPGRIYQHGTSPEQEGSITGEAQFTQENVEMSMRKKQPRLLRMFGFATECDPSSRLACVAVIGEWPGIGSLCDLLEGKTGICRVSQEDLLKWTRQVAQCLLSVRRACGAVIDQLQISTRNVYLFPTTDDNIFTDANMLHARVRTMKSIMSC